MYKVKNCLFLLFLLIFFGTNALCQTNKISATEIRSLTKEASKSMYASNFGKSLMISRKALGYATAIKNDNLISISYNIIGANHNYLAEFDKAILYYKKGIISSCAINNDTIKYQLNNNLGNTYCFEKKQYKVGIDYYKKSLKYSESIADTSAVLLTKLNLAWAYFDINQFQEGSQYLQFLNKYHSKFGDESTEVALNMLNGMYYSHKGENDRAESYFLNAIRLGNLGEEKSDLSFSHHEYSKYLFKKGDYKNAYKNLEVYYKITDELYNKAKLEKANIVGINLELDEYKREIDKIENQNKLQEQSIKKSKIILVLLYVILGVLLLLLYSLFRNDRHKKKLNAELTLANEALVIAKDEAIEASKLKSQFVSTISHELRTPLYGVVGITNMILEEHKELADSPHLSSLKFSARYLLSLVNDVLQINKI